MSKEKIKALLTGFEIVKWKEVEYPKERDQIHWHYYDIIARKG